MRVLGKSGIEVSAIGFGCWAIGGPFYRDGSPAGWGEVDDDESAAALRRALELGITFFDTADVYGTGHSEKVLGQALAGHRDEVVIATKFGNVFDPGGGRSPAPTPVPATSTRPAGTRWPGSAPTGSICTSCTWAICRPARPTTRWRRWRTWSPPG